MKYYMKIIPEVRGKINGIVYHPNSGPLSGRPSDGSEVRISFSNGETTTLISGSDGRFELLDLKLPLSFSILAYPPESERERYGASNSREIDLDSGNPIANLNLTLAYIPPEVKPVYARIVSYGPLGTIDDPTAPITIEFSHPISGNPDYEWIDVDPHLEGSIMSLSPDRRTITLDHGGFHPGMKYTVKVSFLIPFEGAEGLNESFSWSFTIENQGVDPGHDEEPGFPFIIVFVLIAIVAAGALIYGWMRRKAVKSDTMGEKDKNSEEKHEQ
jgi:hypothetical protein